MTPLKHLSPSGIGAWVERRDQFYIRYLADKKPPPEPQTQPMSVGSAFDAYVKVWLADRLGVPLDTDSEELMRQQVDEELWDFARHAGGVVFEAYKDSGVAYDLLSELEKSKEISFEFTVMKEIQHKGIGLVLKGIPDLHFYHPEGIKVILDWKVNGYCSKTGISPRKGYLMLRGEGAKVHGMHKECVPSHFGDITYNGGMDFEQVDVSWARQLAIYGWITGLDVGQAFIAAIDQVVCRPTGIRIAEHRGIISKPFQDFVMDLAVDIWNECNNGPGYIRFDDMTAEESKAHCEALDNMWAVAEDDDFMALMGR